jgi:hypothetical protein
MENFDEYRSIKTHWPLDDFIKKVRKFIRDFPKLNELKGIEESKDSDLALYSSMALDDYNFSPPIIAPVNFEGFPSHSLLMLGTVCYGFLSNGILQLRNSISYNDGGQNVNVWDKGPAYMGNAVLFSKMWESKKTALKRAINIANGYGVIQSADFNLYSYMAMYGGDYIVSTTGTELGTSPMPLSYPGNIPTAGDLGILPPKLKTKSVNFTISDWAPDADPNYYSLHFYHNLLHRDVLIVIEDPLTMLDLSSQIKVFRVTENQVLLKVPMNPDGRLNGMIQCSVPY